MLKYLQKVVVVSVVICGLIFPAGFAGSFEEAEKRKYMASVYGQVFGPAFVAGTIAAMENYLRKHHVSQVENYTGSKKKFYTMIGKIINSEGGMRAINRVAGYGSFWNVTNLPFVGFVRAFNPAATSGWIITQLLTQENEWISTGLRKKLGMKKGFIETLLPEGLPTFDFNVKDGKISAYVKNGKIRIQESIYTKKKNFITNIRYFDNGLSAEITVNNFELALFEHESKTITIKLNPSKASTGRKLSLADFVIENGGKTWNGAIKGSKTADMIWDIGVNELGRIPLFNKLKPLTTFIYEGGARGYTTSVHRMVDKITRIAVGTAAAWPMAELARQFWGSALLNFGVHFLTSYDMLFAFMLSGTIGKATGSRLADVAVFAGAKLDNALMRKFPSLKAKFPPRKLATELNSCADFLSFIARPPLRGRTDLSLDVVRTVLWNRLGKVYTYGTLVMAGAVGWRMAYGVPKGLQTLKRYLVEVFSPLDEDPDAPHDLSGFPPIGASDHSLSGSEEIDPQIDEDKTVFGQFSEVMQNVAPGYAFSSHANLANAEKAFNDENGIEGNQLSLDRESLGKLYDMQADAMTSSLAEYEKNPEAFKDLLWLTFLMTAPIKVIQQEYIAKVNEAVDKDEPIVELKKVLYEFLDEFGLSSQKQRVYKAFEDEFKESGGILMDSFMAEKIVSFISLSDVLIFAVQYAKIQEENPDVLDNRGGQ